MEFLIMTRIWINLDGLAFKGSNTPNVSRSYCDRRVVACLKNSRSAF